MITVGHSNTKCLRYFNKHYQHVLLIISNSEATENYNQSVCAFAQAADTIRTSYTFDACDFTIANYRSTLSITTK